MNNISTEKFIKEMPKIELHIHLEGAIPPELLFKFIKRERYSSIKTIQELKEKFVYKNFEQFIQLWGWKSGFIKYEEDFEVITFEVLKKLSEENVKYAELFYSPGDFLLSGFTVQGITENILNGRERAEKDCGIKCNFIVDLIRDHGHREGMKRIEEVTPYLDRGIIGIGLGGSEKYFPADPYGYVYKEAKNRGFRLTAHGGETDGAGSVRAVIEKLEAERIGHGVRAKEDPALINLLKEKQIPLEICITSNIKTGVVKSFEAHPVKDFFHKGLMVTINSDDPAMFNTSITKEYLLLNQKFGLTIEDIKNLSLNGIRASFMDGKEKELITEEFKAIWKKIEKTEE